MLTFFRRIRKGLLGDGAASKYLLYAIGEIALVVIGILIAWQINKWNEKISSLHIEQQLLKGIQEELQANKSQLHEVLIYHEVAMNCSRNLLELYHQHTSTIDTEKVDSLVNCAISSWTYNPRLGFINSIISSGKLSHIKNERLLTLLSQFEDQVIDANEAQDWILELWRSRLIEHFRIYIPTATDQALKNNKYFSSLVRSRFQVDYKGFFSDRIVESMTGQIHAWQVNGMEEERGLLLSLNEMLSIVKTELSK